MTKVADAGVFSKLRTSEEVWEAAKNIPETVASWSGEEGPRYFVEVSFGVVRTLSHDPARWNRTYEAAMARHLRENPGMPAPEKLMIRGHIGSWSKKSRSRMSRRIATLDLQPLADQVREGRTPAMVTLTMPHDWEVVAPDAQTFKRIVNKWKQSYVRKFGETATAIWKMEFQYRKECAAAQCHDPRAPHVHLLMCPPVVDVDGEPVDAAAFAEWLSDAWCRAVNHKDPEERRKHLAAGTNVSYSDLDRYSDMKRISTYFSKHGAFYDKEYQNTPPSSWSMADTGGARFWGYWQLKAVAVTREVSPDKLDYVSLPVETG